MKHTRHITLVRVLVSVLLLFILMHMADLGNLWTTVQTLNLFYLSGVLGLAGLGLAISTWKWRTLLQTSGQTPTFVRLLRLLWIGAFFNNILPGRTGGDVVRAYGIAAGAQNRPAAIISVVLDRAFNLAALLIIGLFALIVSPGPLSFGLRIGLIAGSSLALLTGLVALYIVRQHDLRAQTGWLTWLAQAIDALQQLSPALAFKVSVASAFYQCTVILSNYGVARSLGIDVAPAVCFYAIPVTALITMLPVSLNGFGLREGAYALVFMPLGLTLESAVSISLIATGCMMAVSLIGGIFYVTGPVCISHTTFSQPRAHLDATT